MPSNPCLFFLSQVLQFGLPKYTEGKCSWTNWRNSELVSRRWLKGKELQVIIQQFAKELSVEIILAQSMGKIPVLLPAPPESHWEQSPLLLSFTCSPGRGGNCRRGPLKFICKDSLPEVLKWMAEVAGTTSGSIKFPTGPLQALCSVRPFQRFAVANTRLMKFPTTLGIQIYTPTHHTHQEQSRKLYFKWSLNYLVKYEGEGVAGGEKKPSSSNSPRTNALGFLFLLPLKCFKC